TLFHVKPTRGKTIFALAFSAAAVLGWFWWLCERDPAIPFLPQRAPAEWIVYPAAPDTEPHSTVELSTEFRRTFALPAAPSKATLSVRAFKACDIRINDVSL